MKYIGRLHVAYRGKVNYGVVRVTKPTALEAARAIDRKREELWLVLGPKLEEEGMVLHTSVMQNIRP